ncbi:hypothetical protein K435DRAFT_871843 [Dendrothele bispora CBS 962.96]|uniref:GCM domain-containing protein n=1 Tax=Dendrothele bispora (strain CBS 962.96) TaxID=1314807 RepID=A0A4S8L4F2_DENBC|nr:hypothetical protein K435DRAFT_871843 [Dendrothele bispora CBS 962.96]
MFNKFRQCIVDFFNPYHKHPPDPPDDINAIPNAASPKNLTNDPVYVHSSVQASLGDEQKIFQSCEASQLPSTVVHKPKTQDNLHVDLTATNAEMVQIQIYRDGYSSKLQSSLSQSARSALPSMNHSQAIELPIHHTQSNAVNVKAQPNLTNSTTTTKSNLKPASLLQPTTIKRAPDLTAPPSQTSIGSKLLHTIDLTDPARLTAFVPLPSQPDPECRHGHDVGIQFTTVDLLEGGYWNGWPSGPFGIDLDHATYLKHGTLNVQWATRNCKGSNGKKGHAGSVNSATIAGGKESYRKCLGVFRCTNDQCQLVTRPKTDSKALAAQCIHGHCGCSSKAPLSYFECPTRSYLIEWGQQGDDIATQKYRYINGKPHNHSRLPQVLHFTAKENEDVSNLVGSNLDKTPIEMYEGGENLDGPTPAAPDLAQAAINRDSWRYHVQKLKNSAKAENGTWFISKFHDWIQKNQDEVQMRVNTIGKAEACVIAFHTIWMRNQLLPNVKRS